MIIIKSPSSSLGDFFVRRRIVRKITASVSVFTYDKQRKENYYATKTTSFNYFPQHYALGDSKNLGADQKTQRHIRQAIRL